jgi:hypothetical protein
MTNYDVRLTSQDRFTVDVNYEVPLKQIQYNNLIIDDISSQFNSVDSNFTLYVNGEEYFPVNEQQLIIAIDGVILTPIIDYQISGSILTIINPPSSGQLFSGIALVTTADLTRTIVFLIDNGSIDITPGSKGYLTLDVSGEIDSWTILSEDVGSIAIDIRKTSYSDFPNNFVSIVGSEFPTLINQDKNKDDILTTWDNSLQLGDILDFDVLSCNGISKCTLTLKLKI